MKTSSSGFTLVELLVAIIILGILAAIAIPSFLSPIAKAKRAVAKTQIRGVNTAQTAYRLENPHFATSFNDLALGSLSGTTASSTADYTYILNGNVALDGNQALVTATSKDSTVKGEAGGTIAYPGSNNQLAISSIVCEARSPGTTAPNAPIFSPLSPQATLTCDPTQEQLQP